MKKMQEAKAKFASKQLSREAQRAVMGGGQFETCRANGFSAAECCNKLAANAGTCNRGCVAGVSSEFAVYINGVLDDRLGFNPGGDCPSPPCDRECAGLRFYLP